MEMRIVQWVIAGLIISGFAFVLSGCGVISTYPTDVRNLPDEVMAKLSIGDTRQKVRSILDAPLIDARSLGLEVYRQTGRDIDIALPGVPLPVPGPGQEVIVIVLVTYNEHDIVNDISTDMWDEWWHGDDENKNFRINAGEYSFVNGNQLNPPEILLGPAKSWRELSGAEVFEGGCSLVFLMCDCPMAQVYLDGARIVDFPPYFGYCDMDPVWAKENNIYGTFIRKSITQGSHRLNIYQNTKRDDFEANFECKSGETIYAEIEVHEIHTGTWGGDISQGVILISNEIPNNVVEIGELRPILWHRGTWFGQQSLKP